METIEVICRNRQLRQLTTAVRSVIKWNTGYIISFSFDDEWGDAKTLRVVNDKGEIITDILFYGNTVELPKVYDTKHIGIGVYEGDLKSTTELILFCKKSILDYDGDPIKPPPEDVYNKIIEGLNSKADKQHTHSEYALETELRVAFNVSETAKILAEQSAQLASNAEEIAKGVENDVLELAGVVDDKADKSHEHSKYAKSNDIPTKVSELENDSGYLTKHQDISGKADKATTLSGYGITDTYTKEEIHDKFDDIDIALDRIIDIQSKYIGGGNT